MERRETLDVLQLLVDLGPKLRIAPTPSDLQGQSAQQWFIDGRVAMYLGAAWQVSAFRKDAKFAWDAAPQPWFKRPVVVLGGSGNAMAAGSTAKDAAWELVKYLASADYQRAQIRLGSDAPTRSSVLNGPEYVSDAPPPRSRRVMAESVKFGRSLNIRTEGRDRDPGSVGRRPLINGQVTPAAFAQDVCQKVGTHLQR